MLLTGHYFRLCRQHIYQSIPLITTYLASRIFLATETNYFLDHNYSHCHTKYFHHHQHTSKMPSYDIVANYAPGETITLQPRGIYLLLGNQPDSKHEDFVR